METGDQNKASANTHVMEGQGMGGHKFGEENHPPTGNDPNNPSQNAGTTNAFLAQTDPLEEHPENNNFKVQKQQGEPDYDGAQLYAKSPQAVIERANDEDDGPSEYME